MAQLPRMRPRFRIPLEGDGCAVLDQLRVMLEAPGAPVEGQVVGCQAALQLPRPRRSLLSPFLNLELEDGQEGTLQSGRVSPAPHVWTGFMAIYILQALSGFSGLMLGWAQTTVNEPPWGFILFPAAAGLIAFVYGAAVIGQGLTADEMYELRSFVDKALERAG